MAIATTSTRPNFLAARFVSKCREHLAEELDEQGGVHIPPVRTGGDADRASDEDGTGWSGFRALLDLIDAPNGLEGVGLLVGLRFRPSDTGILSYACQSQPTFGRSVRVSLPFTKSLGWDLDVVLNTAPDGMLQMELVAAEGRPPSRAVQELWMMLCVRAMFYRLPQGLNGMEMWFTYPTPRYADRFADAVPEAAAHFGRPICCWRFPADWDAIPLRGWDAELESMCLEKLIAVKSHHQAHHDIVTRLKSFILNNLSEAMPRMEDAADHLRLSVATLRRRLREQDCTYQGIIADLRRTLAAEMLRVGRFPPKEVAYRLGYSSPANFHTAFKDWFGCTAREFVEGTGGTATTRVPPFPLGPKRRGDRVVEQLRC